MLLVATGTVCLLSNLLIVAIMVRQKTISGASGGGSGSGSGNKLCLRYRVVNSQAWVGVLTSAVTVYPLKVRLNAKYGWLVYCCAEEAYRGCEQKVVPCSRSF